MNDKQADAFFSGYGEPVFTNALALREELMKSLPGIMEQIDLPAKMVAYCYGQKYAEMICTLVPSKKRLKLGFYKGTELPDPDRLLEGNGKISRYVEIKTEAQIHSPALKKLLQHALALYKQRATALKK